jgi:RNA polymerase sigma-70 factor (ECF subfamily)
MKRIEMCDAECANFQGIYDTYHSKILRYLTHMVGEEEAEDLAQEVFLKASLGLTGFRGDSSLSTWLYRIATNCAYDRLRRRDVLRSPSLRRNASFQYPIPTYAGGDSIGDDCELETSNLSCGEGKPPQVEQQVITKEMGACILRYVNELPDIYRIVILLSDLEELSNKEIAAILGVSLETVKIRLHRGRAILKDQFATRCEYYWVSELSWRVL